MQTLWASSRTGSGGWQITPTRECSFPLGVLEKGDEVANLVDSSFMGKRIERPLLSRGNTGSSLAKDLGVLVLAFAHLKPTATSWPAGSVLELAFPHLKPTATTWSERGKGEHVRLGRRRATAAASLVRDTLPGGAAREAAMVEGAAFETRTPVAEFRSRLRRTAL